MVRAVAAAVLSITAALPLAPIQAAAAPLVPPGGVTQADVIRPYSGTQLQGTVTITTSPAREQRVVVRFARRVDADGSLRGRILNYRRSVLDSRGTCVGPLVTRATASAYATAVGTRAAVRLTWVPAMHAPGDSEVVMTMSTGVSFMALGPQARDVRQGRWAPTGASWIIHGNPMGTVSEITGWLVTRQAIRPCRQDEGHG